MKDKSKLTGKNPNNLKQAIILNLALQEADIEPRDCIIKINHDKGLSYVNSVELPIIFPKKWFKHTSKLHTLKKEYKFYFNGHIGKGSSRETLLQRFINRNDCKVVWSDDGRVIAKKDKYNTDYFTGLAKSEYGLCPHQPGWKGDMDALWTYRYIECLMSKVIPVNFKETPLSKKFTEDSYFVWDDNILETDRELDKDLLDHNYNFALSKFTLNPKQVRTINKFMKKV